MRYPIAHTLASAAAWAHARAGFGKFLVELQAAQANHGVAIGWHRLIEPHVEEGKLVRLTDLQLPAPADTTWPGTATESSPPRPHVCGLGYRTLQPKSGNSSQRVARDSRPSNSQFNASASSTGCTRDDPSRPRLVEAVAPFSEPYPPKARHWEPAQTFGETSQDAAITSRSMAQMRI
jgi:hypothetical protein